MLKKIFIQNFALLAEQEIEFAPGLNILTGETGAGKSLVINALNSILGEKVSADVLRKGAEKAIVEGTFQRWPEKVSQIIRENELDLLPDELLLRRELNRSGRSRTFVNDCLTQAEVLKEISGYLVDLHGQHEHQSLLHEVTHIHFLDLFAGLQKETDEVAQLLDEYWELQRHLNELKQTARELAEKKDFLEFQVREIEALRLDPEEEEQLLQEEKILENYERIVGGCQQLYSALYEDDDSAYSRLSAALDLLRELGQIDSKFQLMAEQLQDAYVAVEDVARSVQDYASHSDFDPARLEEIRTRLAQIARVKKKYGLPVPQIIEKNEQLKAELARLENVDSEIAAVSQKIDSHLKILRKVCEALSTKRRQVAGEFARRIEAILKQIGMEHASFQVRFQKYSEADGGIQLGNGAVAKAHGIDRVAFYVATNPGAEHKPLSKIASGGELSRIMLAIKSVMAEKDQIGVLVFDEIDIGISGRIAEAVGRQLKQLARSHQIICVTHLPQIAGFADRHFSVRKVVQNGQATTVIRQLSDEERIKEIAYLLGGQEITEAVLKNAEALLTASQGMPQ